MNQLRTWTLLLIINVTPGSRKKGPARETRPTRRLLVVNIPHRRTDMLKLLLGKFHKVN